MLDVNTLLNLSYHHPIVLFTLLEKLYSSATSPYYFLDVKEEYFLFVVYLIMGLSSCRTIIDKVQELFCLVHYLTYQETFLLSFFTCFLE